MIGVAQSVVQNDLKQIGLARHEFNNYAKNVVYVKATDPLLTGYDSVDN